MPPGEQSARSSIDNLSLDEAYRRTTSRPDGLSPEEAARRSAESRSTERRREPSLALAFLKQFRSPILLLLLAAALLSGFLGEMVDAITIVVILLASAILSFTQERQANSAVAKLLALVESKVRVVRSGKEIEVPSDAIVRGDVVLLEAGSGIPGDGRVIESSGMLVDEASLTGESAPVEKSNAEGASGALFKGTHVQSGSGKMLVVETGDGTVFGSVASELGRARPEPQFHRGIRRYGYLLMEFTFLLTIVVFAVNVARHQPVIESLLFSLALTVGLTPQLLPAIMSITLARGAQQMAKEKVIVKRLEAIEDFGSMNLLCSDKTGTLTEGSLKVAQAVDPKGQPDDEVLRLAQINALASRAYTNAIDETLEASAPAELQGSYRVIDEIAYDFRRRCQSVIVERDGRRTLIAKGAVDSIVGRCRPESLGSSEDVFREMSDRGFRVLAVATRDVESSLKADPKLETDLTLRGLLAFEDPLRADSAQTVAELKAKGVDLKLITGDNRHVAAYVAEKIGLGTSTILTGPDIGGLDRKALARRVRTVEVFAEVDPIEKERLILACRDAGYVTGYIGDGINDGPALHAADVGLSVSGAVDVAREAADFVMLEKGLAVISRGIDEGRRIFANTMKYVFITSSANFGNMVSMAIASMFMPFLPLLPNQILLNNFMTDIPAMSIAGDAVDPEMIAKPRRWDVRSLRNFMVLFGLHSSVFDLTTFAILVWGFKAAATEFHTAWFIESALTELAILLVIRTRKSLFKSGPGRSLAWASAICAGVVLLVPWTPLGPTLGFVRLPAGLMAAVGLVLVVYVATAEALKHWFFQGEDR